MIFPHDHYTHDTTVEWWYFWGKLNTNEFFHYATFRVGKQNIQIRASHWSLHNGSSEYWEEVENELEPLRYTSTYFSNVDRFSLQTSKFGLVMTPKSSPIVHEWARNYYSIPRLDGIGHKFPESDISIYSDVWMDHEFGTYKSVKPWDWVSIKLDCGMNILAGVTEGYRGSMIEVGGKVIPSDFILDDRHLYFHATTMHFTMRPLVEEKIFYPEFGMPYSEVPFNVMGKGEVIGHGMRERSYRRSENG